MFLCFSCFFEWIDGKQGTFSEKKGRMLKKWSTFREEL